MMQSADARANSQKPETIGDEVTQKPAGNVPRDASAKWHKQLLLSSIPLKRLSQSRQVEGSASGCMIDYCGSRLILTVSHATTKGSGWALEIDHEEGGGMKLLPLPPLRFLGRVDIKDLLQFLEQQSWDDTELVDFAYGVVPSDTISIHEQRGEDRKLHWRAPRTVFKPTFTETPTETECYGFSGNTQMESLPHPTNPNLRILCATETICPHLKYLRSEGDMHFFSLPGKHPGHDHFRGCSGAPIINKRGEVVALVAEGSLKDDTIRGVSLKMYKTAIDIEVGNIGGKSDQPCASRRTSP